MVMFLTFYITGKNVPFGIFATIYSHNLVPHLRELSNCLTVYSLISIPEKFQIILAACLETLH